MSALTRLRHRVRAHGTLLRFGLANSVLEISKLVAGLVALRWVAPAEMGLWQTLLLIPTYSALVQAGVLNGLNRELPFLKGVRDEPTVDRLAATAQAVAIGGGLLLVVAALLAPFLVQNAPAWSVSLVLLCAAASLYVNYLTVTYRASQAFEQLAAIRLGEAVVVLAALPLVYLYGFWGLAAQFALHWAFALVLGHRIRPIRVRPRFAFPDFTRLLRVGVVIFLFGYLGGVAYTLPRVLLLVQGGVELVGLFAPAYAVIGLLRILPNSIAQYVYPQMSFRLGRTQDPRALWPIAWKVTAGLLVLSVPVVVAAALVLPPVVRYFAPAYEGSIPAIRWALATGVLMGASVAVNALNSLKAWGWLAGYTAVVVVASLLGPLLLYGAGSSPLEGVAMGYFLAQLAAFAVGIYAVYRSTHASRVLPAEPGRMHAG